MPQWFVYPESVPPPHDSIERHYTYVMICLLFVAVHAAQAIAWALATTFLHYIFAGTHALLAALLMVALTVSEPWTIAPEMTLARSSAVNVPWMLRFVCLTSNRKVQPYMFAAIYGHAILGLALLIPAVIAWAFSSSAALWMLCAWAVSWVGALGTAWTWILLAVARPADAVRF